jgi:hypothetical protein
MINCHIFLFEAHENETKSDKKRKHHVSTDYEMQMNKSLSQLSISQENAKKKTKLTHSTRCEPPVAHGKFP